MRPALYSVCGVGLDDVYALTLVSELGCGLSSWLGLCSYWTQAGG